MTKPARPGFVLATTVLASSLAFVDGSVVNVGLPAIGANLHAEADALQWVVNAYLLPLTALLLLGGGAGDRFGRRRLLLAGIVVFALASLACALAPSLPWLLAARFLQGVGAAMLLPNSLALLGATFSGAAKGRAVGIWAAAGAVAGAIGPVLGGALIDLGNWRAIFALNLPLAAAAVWLAWRHVPVDRHLTDEVPLDLRGGLLATASLGLLTWGLTLGAGRTGWSATALASIAAGMVGAAGFVGAERQRGERAMLPLTLFGSRSLVGLTLLTLLLYAALGGLLVLLPYALMQGGRYSGTAAGAALLPLPIVLAATSPLAGAFAARIGARLPLTVGPLVVGCGLLLLLRVDADASYWSAVLPAILVVAAGLSAAVAPLTTAVLAAVDARHTGSASGFNSAVARGGGMVATALVGVVLAAQGNALWSAFHAAMAWAAAACLGASVSAFALLGPARRRKPAPG